jgi:replicative DNA helicase
MSRGNGKSQVERPLPSNIEAERLILGAILLEGAVPYSVVRSIGLTVDDFLLEKHKRIYKAMEELTERGEAIDRVTVANELMSLGQLESVDGISYLVSLDDGLPQIYNLESYCRIVKGKALKRRLYLFSI